MAGGVELGHRVGVGQTQHCLRLAQPDQRTGHLIEQSVDQLAHVVAKFDGATPAPRRRSLQERDLARREVGVIGVAPLTLMQQMRLDQLAAVIDGHHALADADVHALAHQLPGHGEEPLAHLDVAVSMHRGRGPVRDLEALGGERQQRGLLHRSEHVEHGPRQRPVWAGAGRGAAPAG